MINDNIKKYRKQKGMSQEEMAVRLNVVRQRFPSGKTACQCLTLIY